MWRMRVVHETGYAYKGPVTASYNEARLTPRSDSRQNVIINRVETAPATRSYRYVDYWGTLVTAFDLHAPHIELEVTSSSVVETDKPEPPATVLDWDGVRSDAVADRYHEYLIPTEYTPSSKRVDRVAAQLAKTSIRRPPSSAPSSGCAANSTTFPVPPRCTTPGWTPSRRARGCARTSHT